MKKVILATIVAFAIAATSFMAVAGGWGWKVFAESPSAYGYGISYSYESAARRALQECAKRTPYGQTCYVVSSEATWIN